MKHDTMVTPTLLPSSLAPDVPIVLSVGEGAGMGVFKEAVLLTEVVLVELEGPVKKKVPAIGLPKPTVWPKVEILKLVRGVVAFTNADAVVSKFGGCVNRRTT